ncbi:MAG: hypothetical protein OEU32_17240, partial [Acidimicrobiia bacterium]|nr:hypothetical protein [Acidimicrobiia bacterium]
VTTEIQLDLTGPGGGTWTISPAGDAPFVTITEGPSGSAAATVVSSAHDFFGWGTARFDWRDSATITGDDAYAASVLDLVNVI